jgi:DNA-binding LacI/PurR family transcriptional regulator
MAVQTQKPDPLYKQLMDSIVSKINSKELKPHDRIGSVRTLAVKNNVSTITVRRCINELVSAGLLYSRQGKGTFVAETGSGSAGQKTKLERAAVIGFLRKDPDSPSSYDQMSQGIQEAADQQGIKLQWTSVRKVISNGGTAAFLDREGMQGAILFGITDDEYIRQVASAAPVVVLDYWMTDKNMDYIVVDNITGSFLLTQYLLQLGHKRIAYIGLKRRNALTDALNADPDSHERLAGCRMALEQAGLPLKDEYIFPNLEGEEKTVKRILALPELPSALFAFTRGSAFKIQDLLQDADVHVPRDMNIVTFSGDPACLSGDYPLTCIHVDAKQMGRLALQRLVDRVQNDVLNGVKISVPGTFVKGPSTGPALKK